MLKKKKVNGRRGKRDEHKVSVTKRGVVFNIKKRNRAEKKTSRRHDGKWKKI